MRACLQIQSFVIAGALAENNHAALMAKLREIRAAEKQRLQTSGYDEKTADYLAIALIGFLLNSIDDVSLVSGHA